MTKTEPRVDPELVARLQIHADAATGLSLLGIEVNDFFISDLGQSECGRFQVDPLETYGVPVAWASTLNGLNELLERSTEEALDAGCAAIQTHLGLSHGDFAGAFFSDNERKGVLQALMAAYLLEQLHQITLN